MSYIFLLILPNSGSIWGWRHVTRFVLEYFSWFSSRLYLVHTSVRNFQYDGPIPNVNIIHYSLKEENTKKKEKYLGEKLVSWEGLKEGCKNIIQKLQLDDMENWPSWKKKWLKFLNDTYRYWHFPNAMGAMGEKHIAIFNPILRVAVLFYWPPSNIIIIFLCQCWIPRKGEWWRCVQKLGSALWLSKQKVSYNPQFPHFSIVCFGYGDQVHGLSPFLSLLDLAPFWSLEWWT